jgi:hypothetical protein
MKIPKSAVSGTQVMLVLLMAAGAPPAGGRTTGAQTPEETPAAEGGTAPDDQESAPGTEDPTRTAGGALRLFMGSRYYQTIRQLRGAMSEKLQARFDHDSAPFNGKRGNRLAAFHFTEKDLKPARTAGVSTATPAKYVATVRSLWEEQGEATEKRTEAITLVQQDGGLWRVTDLSLGTSEKLRFDEAVNGVTALRMILRAWHRGDVAGARPHMSDAFLKRRQGKGEALTAMFAAAEGRAHAAYQIVEMTPQGTTVAVARVRLYETVIGEPGPLDGPPHSLKMVRKGSRWLLDGWD